MMDERYTFAGVGMIITGCNKYADVLKDYFSGSRADSPDDHSAGIVIHVCDSVKELELRETRFYAEGRGLRISDSSFAAGYGRCRYRVDNLFTPGTPVTIWLYYEERRGIRRKARDILANADPYMIGEEHEEDRFLAETLNYSALWWILALALMKFDRIFVHSGIASKNNFGIVLSGTGGCGKTSSVSELLNDGWQYIAEDFGVLSADGQVWQIPKRGAISAEDVSYGSERLVNLIASLPRWQRIRWTHFTKKGSNPLITPSLEQLYGKENIAKKAKLWKCVCIARSSEEDITEKRVSADEMAIRMMGAAFRVIREMYNVAHNFYAVADKECRNSFPSMTKIEEQYCRIARKALEGTEYYVLEVPLGINPKRIAAYVINDFPG